MERGARFNDEIHRLPTGETTFVPKGVYRFKTLEAADEHLMDCIANGMANLPAIDPMDESDEYCRPASLEDLKVWIGLPTYP